MSSCWQPPAFSIDPWYSEPADHRCPYDGWLESLEITEPTKESGGVQRPTCIKLTLLNGFRNGQMVFSYSGVSRHSLTAYSCDQGVGDWLRDEFSASPAGLTCHRITWNCPTNGTSQWLIEAAEVSYEWKPHLG